MKTQVRDFRSMRHVESLANLRGGMIRQEYAEAFQIMRWVD